MAFDLWARAQAKWRGIVVYALLQAFSRFVSLVIHTRTETPGFALFASLVSIATSVYCMSEIWRLLTQDRHGDDAWPSFWGA